MVLPNHLLSFSVIDGNFRSSNYVNLLKEKVLPIIMINLGKDFFFQQDNASVYRSKNVQCFIKERDISTILRSVKSPDINITKDVWKIIYNAVYDGPSFLNKESLVTAITNAIYQKNNEQRQKIKYLYDSIIFRLRKVLKRSGNLYNK